MAVLGILVMGLLVLGALACGGWWRRLFIALTGLMLGGLMLLVVLTGAGDDTAGGIAGQDWRPVLVGAVALVLAGSYAALIRRVRRQSGVAALQAGFVRDGTAAPSPTPTTPVDPAPATLPQDPRHATTGMTASPEAGQAAAAPPPGQLSEPEIDRYLRHIILREIGGHGQRALTAARVLIVGAGGLGAPICLYLAGAGVGRITLADDDRVELSNLHRQVIFTSDDAQAQRPKAEAAATAMAALNPFPRVEVLARRITAEDSGLLRGYDLVLDGTDSFASRQGVNQACVSAGVPLIAGSIAQWDGQVTIYDPARGAPCMGCIFPRPPAPGTAPDCAEGGVAGPLPGIIGTIMAMEAVKLLTGAGTPLRGRMLIWDGLAGEAHNIALARNPSCSVCGDAARDGMAASPAPGVCKQMASSPDRA